MNGVEPTGSPRAGGASTGSSSAYRQIPGARAAIASRVRRRPHDRVVVGDLERPEARGTDIRQPDRLLGAAIATAHPDDALALRRRRCRKDLDGHGRSPGGWGSASGPGYGRPPVDGRGSEGEFPYRAGGPARTWHLADSSVGCRGFIGPVPLPLLIRALRLWADATGTPAPKSNPSGTICQVATVTQRASIAGNATAEADSCTLSGGHHARPVDPTESACTGVAQHGHDLTPRDTSDPWPDRARQPADRRALRGRRPPRRGPDRGRRSARRPDRASTPVDRPTTSSSSTSPGAATRSGGAPSTGRSTRRTTTAFARD